MVSGDKQNRAVIWTPPTENEWRQAVLVIAKQVTMRIAGYLDENEFARDGCRFAWDVFETLPYRHAAITCVGQTVERVHGGIRLSLGTCTAIAI
jgi:hypothetical protein